jgi:transposase
MNIDEQRIPPGKDKRVKLSDAQRAEIILLAGQGLSQRQLASQFGVSRRLIQFILDPDKHKKNVQCRQERGGWKQYYDREKHAEAVRRHRDYKRELYR